MRQWTQGRPARADEQPSQNRAGGGLKTGGGSGEEKLIACGGCVVVLRERSVLRGRALDSL